MKYALWLKQTGYGCDYMVGCGEKLFPLKATTLEGARAEVKANNDDCNYRSADEIEEAQLLSFAEDVLDIFEDAKRVREDMRIEAEKEKKRQQLARLKRELGEE